MNNKLSELLKKVFLGSLAGMAINSNSSAAEASVESSNTSVLSQDSKQAFLSNSYSNTPKLLLKLHSGDMWELASHRSHRSHSSHRSHYSHYSSSTGGSPSRSGGSGGYGGSSGSSGSSGYSGGTNSGLLLSSPNNYTTLGSRVLKRGMSGPDVTQLINLLLKKKYLVLEGGGTSVTGVYTLDQVVESAIKQFQTDNGLTADGQVGPQTLYLLKN
jgi:hypothetical protein